MIDDAAWKRAVALLPAWCRARCSAKSSTVELEFDRSAAEDPSQDLAFVRQTFFEELGGSWDFFDREHRFKTIVCFYRLRRA